MDEASSGAFGHSSSADASWAFDVSRAGKGVDDEASLRAFRQAFAGVAGFANLANLIG